MAVNVIKLDNEPIIVAIITEYAHVDDAIYLFQRSRELRGDLPYVYRITDVSQTTTSFPDLMKVIRQATAAGGSTTVDPTVHVVFVGKSQWVKLFVDSLRQEHYGAVQIPIFETRESALDYVREQIKMRETSA